MSSRVAASRRLLRPLIYPRAPIQGMHGHKACAASDHERNPTDWLNPCGNTSSQNESKRKERTGLNNHSGEMCYESALFTSAVTQHEQFGVCLKENCERTKVIDEGKDPRKKLMDKGDDIGMQPIDQASTLSEGEVENLEQKHLSLTRMINPTDQVSTSSYQQDSYREVNSSEQNAINLEEKEKKVLEKSVLEIVNAGFTSTQTTTSFHCNLKGKINTSTEDPKAGKDDLVDQISVTKLRPPKEIYIILDLNGVLIKRWDKNPLLPGIFRKTKKWIQLRPGCIEFLEKAFSFFQVGIWSTMKPINVQSICALIEQEAHQRLPFFMIWGQDSCYQHSGLHRPDKAHVAADFKPMSLVWKNFPHLGFHNTILVDDSPYKACMNNPHNCIFPDAFDGCMEDTFLTDVLWPYLESMRVSYDIQSFISNNRLGQQPITVGHELYNHVSRVMQRNWI